MRTKKKVLVVEDEQDIRNLMILHLQREGYEVTGIDNGEEALKLLKPGNYDLAIVDWMLPGLPGLEVCQRLRGEIPLLMITARSDAADIVLGLEMGADDYVTKPFEIPVFLARVRALLRRASKKTAPENEDTLNVGHLSMNIDRHSVTCNGSPVVLTPSEFKLLAALIKNTGRVLSRDRLIDLVQGEDVVVTDRAIDTHVFGLRKKLGPCGEFIETIRGVGYRIQSE